MGPTETATKHTPIAASPTAKPAMAAPKPATAPQGN